MTRTYAASRNGGATMNGKPISVSRTHELERSLLVGKAGAGRGGAGGAGRLGGWLLGGPAGWVVTGQARLFGWVLGGKKVPGGHCGLGAERGLGAG